MKYHFYFSSYVILLLILVVCRCIQINVFFYEQMFFEIFVAKGDTDYFFFLRNNSL